jgi:hypothetical protein
LFNSDADDDEGLRITVIATATRVNLTNRDSNSGENIGKNEAFSLRVVERLRQKCLPFPGVSIGRDKILHPSSWCFNVNETVVLPTSGN